MTLHDAALVRLRDAFSHRCTSAWLGHGEVLFLRFGEHELETNFATWRVTPRGAESLVGESVESCDLIDRLGLRLVLTGSKVLVVEPWPTSDGISDAWSLSGPDRQILAVSNDGRIVIIAASTPIRDWFPTR